MFAVTVSFALLSHGPPSSNATVITGNESEPLKKTLYDRLLSQAVLPAHSSCHIREEWVLYCHLVEYSFGSWSRGNCQVEGTLLWQKNKKILKNLVKSFKQEFSLIIKVVKKNMNVKAWKAQHCMLKQTWYFSKYYKIKIYKDIAEPIHFSYLKLSIWSYH